MSSDRYQSRPAFPLRAAGENPHVTSAIGVPETRGRARVSQFAVHAHRHLGNGTGLPRFSARLVGAGMDK